MNGDTDTSEATDRRVRPILRWAGSKRQLLPKLSEYWQPGYSRYVEPFAGSCSLFFALNPPKALISDKNADLIHTYRTLCQDPDRLYDLISSYPPDRDLYYRIRATDPAILDDVDRAARFIYLNRNSFNGIYRTNAKGQFNVPFSPSRVGALPSRDEFRTAANRLAGADLRAWDFGTALRYVRAGDFVYLDPPYAVASRRVFTEYGPKVFTSHDLQRLAAHLDRIDRKGAAFVLSYADSSEVRAIGKRWTMRRVRVQRNVAGFTGARRTAYEMIVTNRGA